MTTEDPLEAQPDTYLRVVLSKRDHEEVIKLVCDAKQDGCGLEAFLNEMRSRLNHNAYEAVCSTNKL